MKIRLDDVMQSFSYPFDAAYYYYIPLETVLMFMNGMIYGKAVHDITTEDDVKEHEEDFIKLPDLGENGRHKVMHGFLSAIPDGDAKERVLRRDLRKGALKGLTKRSERKSFFCHGLITVTGSSKNFPGAGAGRTDWN